MLVRVLGPIEVDNGADIVLGGPTQRRIIAILALDSGDVVSVDRLVDATWAGHDAPALAERNVRTYVHRLRVALGPEHAARIETVAPGYRLHLNGDELDAQLFAELAGTASRLANMGDVIGALDAIAEADRLWRGRPFGEFADEPWARAEVERLTEVQIGLGERRAEMLLEAGRFSDAVSGLEELARAVPLREQPRALLMRALYQSGRQVEALRSFQEYRSLLVDEIGVDPSADLVALDRAIATGDADLRQGTTAPRSVGAYELHERIGEGAFAVVHRATQPSLGREVAIKVIHAELANRPVFIRRFEAEAQMVARVQHPSIVPLYDYWREPDQAFLVMRWMAGGSLEANLDAGSWDVSRTSTMVEEIAGALSAAHDAGIVHRDVKPANILLDEQGRCYLADFGIALETAELARPEVALSEGSPVYASPEQLRKEPAGPPTDVHALAIVAFRTLSGQVPFPAGDPTALLRHQLDDPIPSVRVSRPELPAAIDDVLAIATAKHPEDRYPTPMAFAVALKAAAHGTGEGPALRLASTGPRANPYKGLRPFEETDAGDFHGRERLLDELLAAESDPDTGCLLAVVGPSGSGKSSVVRAALIPAIRAGRVEGSQDWFVTTMVPGVDPFEAFETALLRVAVNPPASLLAQLKADPRGILRGVRRVLPDGDATMLMVIDQFEELFTSGGEVATVNAFLEALTIAVTEPGSPLRVVLTLRADFYDRPLRHPKFAALLKQSTVAVTPLAPDELEHAIVSPAESVGVGFEPGLVARIAADVTSQAGSLPLLQYALTQAFDSAEGDQIRISDYEAIGGLTGAIAKQADELWTAASVDEQLATRYLFGRLVVPGEGTEDTSRRVLRSEVGDDSATAAVVDRLGDARLLTFDRDAGTRQPTVEVAHEALIREWPRLREWLDEDREGLRVHRHLTNASSAWNERGRDDGDLYRGARLETAESWIDASSPALNQTESGFLSASADLRAGEESAERNRIRRLRRLLVTTGAVAIVALVAGALAFWQKDRADSQAALASANADESAANADLAAASAELADQRAAEAETERAAAQTATAAGDLERLIAESRVADPTDPTTAILLAAEAHRIEPSERTLASLHRALTARPGFLGALESGPLGLDLTELGDGRRVITTTRTTVDLWDIEGRVNLASWPIPGPLPISRFDVRSHASSDGHLVAVTTPEQTTLLNPLTGIIDAEIAHNLPGASGRVVQLSPDGLRLAVGLEDGTVNLYDVSDLTRPTTFTLLHAATDLEWSPDGEMLVVGTASGAVEGWNASTASVEWSRSGEERPATDNSAFGLLFSAAGDRLLVSRMIAAEDVSITGRRRARVIEVIDPRTGGLVDEANPPILASDIWLTFRWTDLNENAVFASSLDGEVAMISLSSRTVDRLPDAAAPGGTFGVLRDIGVLLAAGRTGIELRSLDGTGPLSRQIPLSEGQEADIALGHLIIAFDEAGNRVVTSILAALPPRPVSVSLTENMAEPVLFDLPDDRAVAVIVDGFGEFVLSSGFDGEFFFSVSVGVEGPLVGPAVRLMEPPTAVSLSSRGDRLLLFDGQIANLYDTASGELITALPEIPGPPTGVGSTVGQFSPDGGTVMVWNGWGAGLFESQSGLQQWVTDKYGYVAPGPTGDWITTADERGVIQLRDPDTLSPIGEPMIGHVGNVIWVEMRPDEEFIATWGRDETARVFSVETGEQFGRELPFPIGNRPQWSPDGAVLAVPTTTGFHLWNYDTDTWADIACEVAGRNMTQEEWDQFGPRTIERRATCPQFPLDP